MLRDNVEEVENLIKILIGENTENTNTENTTFLSE
jgi:hypothetical protein